MGRVAIAGFEVGMVVIVSNQDTTHHFRQSHSVLGGQDNWCLRLVIKPTNLVQHVDDLGPFYL